MSVMKDLQERQNIHLKRCLKFASDGIIVKIIGGFVEPGWASITVTVTFFSGVQLLILFDFKSIVYFLISIYFFEIIDKI